MIKKILLVISVAVAVVTIPMKAQTSFVFLKDSVAIPNDTAYSVVKSDYENWAPEGEPEDYRYTMESGLKIYNPTNTDVNAIITQEVLTIPSVGMLALCGFENCYYGNVIAPQTGVITAGDTIGNFHAFFKPEHEQYTIAVVKYSIYQSLNPTNKATVTVTYNFNENSVAASVNETGKNTTNVKLYQQADRQLVADYSFNTSANRELIVFDMMGKQIAKTAIVSQQGKAYLVNEYNSGIYFYSVFENGRVIASNKIVVK